MRRISAFCGLLILTGIHPAVTRASTLSDALPPHAHLLGSVAIPGTGGAIAVAYDASGPRVGIVRSVSGRERLTWSLALAVPVTDLSATGKTGLFDGIGGGASGTTEFFAYSLRGKVPVSAIAGHPKGIVESTDGVQLTRDGFIVRRRDHAHQGSVAYAFISTYRLRGRSYVRVGRVLAPDYRAGKRPRPSATVVTPAGDTILLRLTVASTEPQRETGLMYVRRLDPDSGMIFVWPTLTLESFWMENTYIPLTVAFLSPDGTIQQLLDMQPLTAILHTPALPYQYAIEVNQGFFAAHGIRTGDRLTLDLS